VAGSYPGSPETFQTSVFAVASNFQNLQGLDDGKIETGGSIFVTGLELENTTNGVGVAHSLSLVLASLGAGSMQTVLYEPESSSRTFVFWVFD
jgi:hypothetical protein